MDKKNIVDARIAGEYDGRDSRIPGQDEATGEDFFWVNTVEAAQLFNVKPRQAQRIMQDRNIWQDKLYKNPETNKDIIYFDERQVLRYVAEKEQRRKAKNETTSNQLIHTAQAEKKLDELGSVFLRIEQNAHGNTKLLNEIKEGMRAKDKLVTSKGRRTYLAIAGSTLAVAICIIFFIWLKRTDIAFEKKDAYITKIENKADEAQKQLIFSLKDIRKKEVDLLNTKHLLSKKEDELIKIQAQILFEKSEQLKEGEVEINGNF